MAKLSLIALALVSALAASSCASAPSEPLAATDTTTPPSTVMVTTTMPATTSTSPALPVADPVDVICEHLTRLSMGGRLDPDVLYALYDDIEASAPSDIAPDIAEFIANAREISALIEPFVGDLEGAEAAIANADPELQQAMAEIAETATTGVLPDSAFGRVMSYQARYCQPLESVWDGDFEVGTFLAEATDAPVTGDWPSAAPELDPRVVSGDTFCVDAELFRALRDEFDRGRSIVVSGTDGNVRVSIIPPAPQSNFLSVSCVIE